MVPRPRPALLAAGFIALFAIIANLAWATAITTTGPWYDAATSTAVYALTAAVAAFLTVVLVTNASRVSASLDASLRRVDRRVAFLRAKSQADGPRAMPAPAGARLDDPDLDTLMDGLESLPSSALIRVEKAGHDTLMPLSVAASFVRGGVTTDVLRQLVRERMALREAHDRVWAYAAGPIGASLLFLCIAGPMLPGAGPFATVHFVLNTTLVLFVSYGLAPLVAWTVVAMSLSGFGGRRAAA